MGPRRFLNLLATIAGQSRAWMATGLLAIFWLGLVCLLGFQVYLLSADELALPASVVHRIEARLAEAGLRATCARTWYDPSGDVWIENLQLSLPAYAEPVITARSVFVRLNRWPLLWGKLDLREVRLTGVTAAVPAMLSPSGRSEEIVQSLDATFAPAHHAVTFHQLSARVLGVAVSARGTLMLPPSGAEPKPATGLANVVADRFSTISRHALAAARVLAQCDQPSLELEFAPSETGAATVRVIALARALRLTTPAAVEARDVRASTKVVVFGEAPPWNVEVSTRELRLPHGASALGVQAWILGRIQRAGARYDLREMAATADLVSVAGVTATALSTRVFPRDLPRVAAEGVAHLLGAPLTLWADVDLAARRGLVQFEGAVSPRVLDVVHERFGVNVRSYYTFESLQVDQAELRFGPGWRFEKLNAQVRVPRMSSRGIVLEDGRARVELDRERVYAPEAFARVGGNFAQGSYEQTFRDRSYRFLLEGQVRPLDISGWFRPWWSNFFRQLEFPVTPPMASVDVRGTWRDGRQSNVFVFADVAHPVIRGTAFDRARTRLFIRPAFYDGLEILGTQGQTHAFGRFTYIADPKTNAWQTLELGLDSTLDLNVAAQLLGPAGVKAVAPFRLAAPPNLKIRGQFAGPQAPGGAREKLRIEARTSGEFRVYEFPLHDVSFIAALDRDELVLDEVKALFAGGVATGHARLAGKGEQRRLGFDFGLDDANLGQLAAGVADFLAAKTGEPPNPPGKFVQEKANVRIDFATSAEGWFTDPLSYHGTGSAVLHGAEISEVPLLGQLSELLKFTALRFTEARTNFKIEGPKLVFPTVTLRGANSAIDGHGTFALDRRELDFNVKVFPFQESGGLLKTVVGAVLTPLSNALEVKLTGSFAKPHWAFVMGPTNLLRALAPVSDANPKSAQAAKPETN